MTDFLNTDLARYAIKEMDAVLQAGHRVRVSRGKDPNAWLGQSARIHLSHALVHVQNALGTLQSDIMDAVDGEGQFPTYTPHISNALLRLAMAIHQLRAAEEKSQITKGEENDTI